MNIVAYGGGTNSTAMLIGLYYRKIPIDLILCADTGCEQPHTYAYIPIMDAWLSQRGLPSITTVGYVDRNGQRLTLEQECLRSKTLPSLAYGFKRCSLKHKVAPQEKFCNHYEPCLEVWKQGGRVNKLVGYGADELRRKLHVEFSDPQNKKYSLQYPLIDWGWGREECISAILQEGLPLPGKSSCFFCPAMKRNEIRTLYHRYPDLFERAVAIEKNAMPNLTSVKGLGRNWSWQEFVEADRNQLALREVFSEDNLPCSVC